jgi:hypothetical protein
MTVAGGKRSLGRLRTRRTFSTKVSFPRTGLLDRNNFRMGRDSGVIRTASDKPTHQYRSLLDECLGDLAPT